MGDNKFLPFQLLHLNYDASAYQSEGQCLYFCAEFNFPRSCFHLYLYFTVCKENKEIMNNNIEIYSVLYSLQLYVTYLFFFWVSCSGVSEREAVRSFEAWESSGPPSMHCGS